MNILKTVAIIGIILDIIATVIYIFVKNDVKGIPIFSQDNLLIYIVTPLALYGCYFLINLSDRLASEEIEIKSEFNGMRKFINSPVFIKFFFSTIGMAGIATFGFAAVQDTLYCLR